MLARSTSGRWIDVSFRDLRMSSLCQAVSQINIDRQPGQIPDEQVNRRTAFQREAFFLRDERKDTHQQGDLTPIALIRWYRDSLVR